MKTPIFLISILLGLPSVMAGPYCLNGQVGSISIMNFSILEPIVVNGPQNRGAGFMWEIELLNHGRDIVTKVVLHLVDSTNNEVLFNETFVKSLEGNRTEREGRGHELDFLSLPVTSNETNNFTFIIKIFEIPEWQSNLTNETTNCDHTSKEVDVQLYREVVVESFQIRPDFLDCGNMTFNAAVSVKNIGAKVENTTISVMDEGFHSTQWSYQLKGNPLGLLNIHKTSEPFFLDSNETKTINFELQIPPFHLYRHPFSAVVESTYTNVGSCFGHLYPAVPHSGGLWFGPRIGANCADTIDLTIAKCPTDNAQDIRPRISVIESTLSSLGRMVESLFKCVIKNGLNCPLNTLPE